MDILPIQASSVPCERVFSSSKETTTARRNKLSPQLIEALQVLKFEHKYNKKLNFTIGFDKDEEITELEAFEEAQPIEDLDALFQNLH
jgi:hAT family C-terminal dimerisation region